MAMAVEAELAAELEATAPTAKRMGLDIHNTRTRSLTIRMGTRRVLLLSPGQILPIQARRTARWIASMPLSTRTLFRMKMVETMPTVAMDKRTADKAFMEEATLDRATAPLCASPSLKSDGMTMTEAMRAITITETTGKSLNSQVLHMVYSRNRSLGHGPLRKGSLERGVHRRLQATSMLHNHRSSTKCRGQTWRRATMITPDPSTAPIRARVLCRPLHRLSRTTSRRKHRGRVHCRRNQARSGRAGSSGLSADE